MKIILAIGGIVAAILLASSIAGALPDMRQPSSLDYARDSAEMARLDREARAEEVWQPIRAAAVNVAIIIIVLSVPVLALVWGVAALVRFRYERQPSYAGLLPVRERDLAFVAPQALGAFHAARQLEASYTSVPATISYAPHTTYSPRSQADYRSDASGVAPSAVAAAIAPSVPTFGQLLNAGRIGRGQPLLLGVDSERGEELVGSWLDLYATATAGLPGSGKTTSQRFFAAQTALHGAKFVVCDPHASAGEDSLAATLMPLHPVFLCDPAEDPKDILHAVRFVANIGENRKRGRDDSRTPVILWVDELTGLLGRSDVGDELAGLLEQIAQEYRKKWVYLSASGQIWTASRTTSELRDSLSSVLCHRMKRNQARLLLPTDEAAQVERLDTGEAILWRTSGATARVRIPNTTAIDVSHVAALLGTPTVNGLPTRRNEGASEGASEGAAAVPLRGGPDALKLSPEEAAIVSAFRAGKSASDLAAELAGGKKSGDAYKIAARRVAEILRKALA